MNLKDMQTALVQDGRRLSALADDGKLTHEEWQRAVDSWDKAIGLLPENERDGMDTEFLFLIEPEKS